MDILTAEAQTPAPISMAALFKAAFDGKDLRPLRAEMIERLQRDSLDAVALMNLCTIDQLLGDQASGLKYQKEALGLHRVYRSQWPYSSRALRVLTFMAPGDIGINTPIDFLLEDKDVVLYSLYVVPGMPLANHVPDHDVAIVTAGESDANRSVLREIDRLIASWRCPVLNRPDRVLRLSREEMYSRLQAVPGLVMPPTFRVNRAALEALGHGSSSRELPVALKPPLIARPVGSHAGRGLQKLDDSPTIVSYLADRKEEDFFISPFVDYRSSDGLFRKYRIIWVDGRPYPCHMAVADEWKVWYYNAGMAQHVERREEEKNFLTAFDDGFGRRHAAALAGIVETFGLEYMGIDCAELPDGRLLVFEGEITLVAHNMDSPSIYPYKDPAMRRLFAGFYEMLQLKASIGRVSA